MLTWFLLSALHLHRHDYQQTTLLDHPSLIPPRALSHSGAYQWRLFALCGCGWMSDNSALACIAVILPRVQIHFGLKDEVVGMLSASTMAGVSRAEAASGEPSEPPKWANSLAASSGGR